MEGGGIMLLDEKFLIRLVVCIRSYVEYCKFPPFLLYRAYKIGIRGVVPEGLERGRCFCSCCPCILEINVIYEITECNLLGVWKNVGNKKMWKIIKYGSRFFCGPDQCTHNDAEDAPHDEIDSDEDYCKGDADNRSDNDDDTDNQR